MIHETAFVHPDALVYGAVTLGARASVWPGAVLRADNDRIVIGDDSNVQDGTVVHCDPGLPALVGARVGIGHRAIIHGCTIEDDCLIGMGAILLNGVVIGRGSLVGAGALCTEGMVVPPDSVVLGAPARVVKQVTPALRERMARTVRAYLELQVAHREGRHPRRAVADASRPGRVEGDL